MPAARQQIPNTHHCTNCEPVFSMQSVQQLHNATTKELLGACFLCGPCRGVISRTSLEFSQLSLNQSEEQEVDERWPPACGVSCETVASQYGHEHGN